MMRRGVGRVGRPGLVGTMARTAVVAGTATAVVGGVSRHQQGKQQQAADAAAYQQEQAMAQQQAMALKPVAYTSVAAFAHRKFRASNSRRSSRGFGTRAHRQTNTPTSATAPRAQSTKRALVHPQVGVSTMA